MQSVSVIIRHVYDPISDKKIFKLGMLAKHRKNTTKYPKRSALATLNYRNDMVIFSRF